MTKARTPARASQDANSEQPLEISPTEGGSYIRLGDGRLQRVEEPDAEPPAEPAGSATAIPADDSQEG